MEPSSVEDGNQPISERHPVQFDASMEPSSVEDGNVKKGHRQIDAIRLQWSRPQLRTETMQVERQQRNDCQGLQWSRPQLRTETSIHDSDGGAQWTLQWSRPQLRTETELTGD